MKKIWNKFQNISSRIFSFIFLHIAYFIGIGLTSAAAKFTGKHFLDTGSAGSTWQVRRSGQKMENMY